MPARMQEQLASALPQHMQLHAISATAGAVQVPEAATGAPNYCNLLGYHVGGSTPRLASRLGGMQIHITSCALWHPFKIVAGVATPVSALVFTSPV